MKTRLYKKIFFLIFFCSCTHISENTESSIENPTTVEVGESYNVNNKKEFKSSGQQDVFLPHVIKANRNKKISVFLGKLEDRMFYVIGIFKWLESNGYKVSKIQTTSFEEEQLFAELKNSKKTSYVEWKLYQCCKDNFPLEEPTSYKDVLKKMDAKIIIPSYSQDQAGCDDFTSDNSEDHVLCVLWGSQNKTQIKENELGMKKIEVYIAPIDYQKKLSLVDYIDLGQNMAKVIKK